MKTKKCCTCDQEKDIRLFPTNRSKKDGRHSECRDCKSERGKRDYRVYYADIMLQRKFKKLEIDYEKMLEKQGGGCAICGIQPRGRRHAVDHDHKTDEVRGLLCDRCNRGIGFLDEDPVLLAKAAEYLLRFK